MMLEKQEHQLQPKLSTILKQELSYIPQTYGAFSDGRGKYCALAAVAKYFGYDVESDKRKNGALASSDLIPLTIIERIEIVFHIDGSKNTHVVRAKRGIIFIVA